MGDLWVGTEMGLALYPLIITTVIATLAILLGAIWSTRERQDA